eukprot:CAMPEP_0170630722 /NCGR_PEP_ID=MMETSP0224-20130122/34181_1 /TAXON_ID=285029 /ORGANISM="Togula jolla, Strain CCCM 725" /LENGTH=184 /DNA_ID=CAMNT_0010958857 /DNA_START=178 /DNA_END=733 /DNA_ORIENTATION=+
MGSLLSLPVETLISVSASGHCAALLPAPRHRGRGLQLPQQFGSLQRTVLCRSAPLPVWEVCEVWEVAAPKLSQESGPLKGTLLKAELPPASLPRGAGCDPAWVQACAMAHAVPSLGAFALALAWLWALAGWALAWAWPLAWALAFAWVAPALAGVRGEAWALACGEAWAWGCGDFGDWGDCGEA